MKKILAVLFVIVGMGTAFAQGMPSVFITPIAGNKIEITASNAYSIAVLTDRARFSLQKEERDRFVTFLDLHINLLNEVSKLELPNDSTFITSFEASSNVSIRTSVSVKDGVPYISMYISYLGTYTNFMMNQSSLQELKAAIQSAQAYNTKRSDSEAALQRLIADVTKSLNS